MELCLCENCSVTLLCSSQPPYSPFSRSHILLVHILSRLCSFGPHQQLNSWPKLVPAWSLNLVCVLGKLSAKVLDSDRDESVTRVEFDNFLNFLRRLLAVIDNNQDCAGFNSYKTLHIYCCIRTLPRTERFPKGGNSAPRSPRDCPRGAKFLPKGTLKVRDGCISQCIPTLDSV